MGRKARFGCIAVRLQILKCELKSLLSKPFYQIKLYSYLYGMAFHCATVRELAPHLKVLKDFSSMKNKYVILTLKFCQLFLNSTEQK